MPSFNSIFFTFKFLTQVKNDVSDVTMLVNNAGIVTGKKFLECDDKLIEKTFQVNTVAHFWVKIQQL